MKNLKNYLNNLIVEADDAQMVVLNDAFFAVIKNLLKEPKGKDALYYIYKKINDKSFTGYYNLVHLDDVKITKLFDLLREQLGSVTNEQIFMTYSDADITEAFNNQYSKYLEDSSPFLENDFKEGKEDEHVYMVCFGDGTVYNYYYDYDEALKEASKLNSEASDNKAVVKPVKKDDIEKDPYKII